MSNKAAEKESARIQSLVGRKISAARYDHTNEGAYTFKLDDGTEVTIRHIEPAKKPAKVKKVERGVLYPPTGAPQEVTPLNGKVFTLSELQRHVGGYIETLICAERYARGYVDEDGLSKRLPPNQHTWNIIKANVYELNGYERSWRVSGPILVVKNVEVV